MNRCERAYEYHKSGCNCAQSVLAAFSDLTGLSEEASFRAAAGFGSGAGSGELCGAISGAVMALGLLIPGDGPLNLKKQAVSLSREVQKRFTEKFGAVRCHELLQNRRTPDDPTSAAQVMGLTNHCSIMVVTAVEIVEELLAQHQA